MDLASVLTAALANDASQDRVEVTFRTFLEGLEHSVVVEAAGRTARGVISQADVAAVLASSDRWNKGVAFIRSL